MATKKNWDGRSRPSNDRYQKNKKERTDPLVNFSEDLQESIHRRTYKIRKDHATDMSYENETKKK